MMLPMMGFVLALIVIGCLGSLVAIADRQHAGVAPYIGSICLFAGLGALCLSLGLSALGEAMHSMKLSGAGFFIGYALGGIGGAALGVHRAFRHQPNNVRTILNHFLSKR